MSTLQAIPTQHGIDILNSELKNTVTKYRLIGALTHDAPSESLYSFYENTIETSYYDDNGVLTFILNLPIEQHFDEYLHQIHVLDSSNQSVIECSTPKVALPKGIGGMVTLKAAISGEAGQVIFKHSEFVTETELVELHLPKYALKETAQFLPYNPERFYTTGEICYTKNPNTSEITYWQWYSNIESLKGKDPLDTTNRHEGWTATDKPFYWIEYKADIIGMPFYWLDTTAPEWAVMEINVDLPSLVYWRLARRYPSLVFDRDGVSYINTGEIRAEFLRVLDQGRGIDVNRQINTAQRASIMASNDDGDTANTCLQNVNFLRDEYGWERVDISHIPNTTHVINWATGASYSKGHVANIDNWMGASRSRNVARPMAIAI